MKKLKLMAILMAAGLALSFGNSANAEVGFINVNDKTVEGLRYKNKDIFTVQFHPEACPGPQDSNVLFGEFIDMMESRRK